MTTETIDRVSYARPREVGVRVDDCPTLGDMAEKAGINWTVEKGVLAGGPTMWDLQPIDGKASIYRTDTRRVLGFASDGYEIWQNMEALAFTESLLQDGVLRGERILTFGGGQIVALLARFPEDGRVAGDAFRRYMLVTAAHNGHTAASGRAVNTRVVCQNTWAMAMREETPASFSIRHTKSLRERLEQAHAAMQITTAAHRRMEEFLNAAATVQMADRQIGLVEDEAFGKIDERGPRVLANVDRFRAILGEEQRRAGKTAYATINALTGYADHVRGGIDNGRWPVERQERHALTTLMGTGMAFKNRTIEAVREVVGL